jgi:hypothetical protein
MAAPRTSGPCFHPLVRRAVAVHPCDNAAVTCSRWRWGVPDCCCWVLFIAGLRGHSLVPVSPFDACAPITTVLPAGGIALIARGTCSFATKVCRFSSSLVPLVRSPCPLGRGHTHNCLCVVVAGYPGVLVLLLCVIFFLFLGSHVAMVPRLLQVRHAQQAGAAAAVVLDMGGDSHSYHPLAFSMSDDGTGHTLSIPSVMLHGTTMSNSTDSSASAPRLPLACAIGLRPQSCSRIVDAARTPYQSYATRSHAAGSDSGCTCAHALSVVVAQLNNISFTPVVDGLPVDVTSPDVLSFDPLFVHALPTMPSSLEATGVLVGSLFRSPPQP